MKQQKPKFIELFAGIGGFRLAFEQAGYQCVYSSEIDVACQEVYFNNFGEEPNGDITEIDIEEIPDFDVLTAGFPCQPFSICGKRRGFEDTRGTLFFHICEIIKYKQPPVVLLENVKHLIHHDKGRTLNTIVRSLEDLGYIVDYKLLNSKNYSLPQNRERIIILATKSIKFNFNFLRESSSTEVLKDYLCKNGNFEYLNRNEYTLIDNPKKQTSGLIFVGYRSNKSIWKGVRPNTEHLSRVHRQPNRIYSVKGVHPTIPSQETSGRFFIYIPESDRVRKLTIRECYRIMGFPNDFKLHDSLAECYKQIGNSVCIPMIYQLAFQIQKQNLLLSKKQLQKENTNYYQPQAIQLKISNIANMNHKKKLLKIYSEPFNIDNANPKLPNNISNHIEVIAEHAFKKQKGVYTVLITLLVHKIIEPDQDIRYHQSSMPGGFSGRTIDTQHITPTLKELGLPAMAESGWLSRSLEQPYPYTLDYQGKISNKNVKKAFLEIIDFVESNPNLAELTTKFLIRQIKDVAIASQIKIIKLANPEKINITTVIHCLEAHFNHKYNTSGGSKLPVIALYAIYQRLILELERYKGCILKDLGSHTASDRTSKTAGDIEIFSKSKKLIEAIEIKQGKPVSLQITLNAKDKILEYNPRRYYILSSAGIKQEDELKIKEEIASIATNHGCQVIVNGILPTLKYYLRLVTSVEDFIEGYSLLVEQDKELQAAHKIKWNQILKTLE